MSLTLDVKDELTNVRVGTPQELNVEIASILRYCASLELVGNNIIIEAELTHAPTAKRLEEGIKQLYNYTPEVQIIGAGSSKRPARHVLRWTMGGNEIARRTELIDRTGMPVRGLPRTIISGSRESCIAAWRGAFLAQGSIAEPGRSAMLEVTAPSSESALALVGCARRLGFTVKNKETRGSDRVVMKDDDAIGELLSMMGATHSRDAWENQRIRREVHTSASRLANFDNANLQRSVRAAIQAAARVERAFELLGDDIPPSLEQAGKLRMEHRQVSLEELGRLASPPETKDAIAGKLRRLMDFADKRAEELGVPDTHAAVTNDLFQDVE